MSRMNRATGRVTANGPRKARNMRRVILTGRRYSSNVLYLGLQTKTTPCNIFRFWDEVAQCALSPFSCFSAAATRLRLLAADFESCLPAEASSSAPDEEGFVWKTEQFADLKIVRYQIPGWEKLSERQQALVYCLNMAGIEWPGHHVRPEQPLQPPHPSAAGGHLPQLRRRSCREGMEGV